MSADELEFRRWLANAAKGSASKIEGSQVFLSLFSGNVHKDPLAVLQLGYAVVLNKPLYLAVPIGTRVPEALLLLSRGVEFFDPNDRRDMERATRKLAESWTGNPAPRLADQRQELVQAAREMADALPELLTLDPAAVGVKALLVELAAALQTKVSYEKGT